MRQSIFNGLLKLVYPPKCPVCKACISEKDILCDKCLNSIAKLSPPFCKICGEPIAEENKQCKKCRRKNSVFKQHWSICKYEGVIKECIHLFKYNRRLGLNKVFSALIKDFIKTYQLPVEEIDCIAPVPLHKSRLREREFNQADLIAEDISKEFSIDLESNLIKRIRNTRSQVDLPKFARYKNVKDAFALNALFSVEGKNLLLVDDVMTTGATLEEAANILKKNGAKDIYALTLARS